MKNEVENRNIVHGFFERSIGCTKDREAHLVPVRAALKAFLRLEVCIFVSLARGCCSRCVRKDGPDLKLQFPTLATGVRQQSSSEPSAPLSVPAPPAPSPVSAQLHSQPSATSGSSSTSRQATFSLPPSAYNAPKGGTINADGAIDEVSTIDWDSAIGDDNTIDFESAFDVEMEEAPPSDVVQRATALLADCAEEGAALDKALDELMSQVCGEGEAAVGEAAVRKAALGDAALGDTAMGEAADDEAAMCQAAESEAVTSDAVMGEAAVGETATTRGKNQAKGPLWFTLIFERGTLATPGPPLRLEFGDNSIDHPVIGLDPSVRLFMLRIGLAVGLKNTKIQVWNVDIDLLLTLSRIEILPGDPLVSPDGTQGWNVKVKRQLIVLRTPSSSEGEDAANRIFYETRAFLVETLLWQAVGREEEKLHHCHISEALEVLAKNDIEELINLLSTCTTMISRKERSQTASNIGNLYGTVITFLNYLRSSARRNGFYDGKGLSKEEAEERSLRLLASFRSLADDLVTEKKALRRESEKERSANKRATDAAQDSHAAAMTPGCLGPKLRSFRLEWMYRYAALSNYLRLIFNALEDRTLSALLPPEIDLPFPGGLAPSSFVVMTSQAATQLKSATLVSRTLLIPNGRVQGAKGGNLVL